MHGRAGRDKLPGSVIIQSYNPENFSIQCAKKQNYDMFYETELALRRQLKYPPFCDIIVISFNSLSEQEIIKVSNEFYEDIQKKFLNYLEKTGKQEEYKIFRPMPSPIDKIQNRYRWRIIIKGKMIDEINKIINNLLFEFYKKDIKTTKISVDVNPNNMM